MASFRAVSKPTLLLAALALSLSACLGGEEDQPPAERTPPVLARVPIVPGSQLRDTAGTREAARATLLVGQPPDSVAAFYRRRLTAEGWRIMSDMNDGGGVVLYAQREGPPLWVQIRPGPASGTTMYALIGAMPEPPQPRDSVR